MKIVDVFFAGVTFAVGCSVLLFGYVLLTGQDVDIRTRDECSDPDSDSQKIEEQQRIRTDDVKILNESISRVKNDTEYFKTKISTKDKPNENGNGRGEEGEDPGKNVKNLNESISKIKNDTKNFKNNNSSKGKPNENGNGRGEERKDPGKDDHKKQKSGFFIDRMRAPTRSGLPNATGPHDLSGYVSVFHRNQSLQLQCKKCVIVSSSGQMLHSKAGHAIDADESCIFRMNAAPTLRFEDDVGARTTVRVLAHSSIPRLLRTQKDILGHPNATKILIELGPHKCIAPGGSCEKRLKEIARKYPKVDFYVFTKEEMFYGDDLFEAETGWSRESGSWLSTGLFTMILARTVCDEIHVYGMVNENHCRDQPRKKVPYHYYDPGTGEECAYYRRHEKTKVDAHRFMAEKAIFASWAKLKPKIYFHQPEWE